MTKNQNKLLKIIFGVLLVLMIASYLLANFGGVEGFHMVQNLVLGLIMAGSLVLPIACCIKYPKIAIPCFVGLIVVLCIVGSRKSQLKETEFKAAQQHQLVTGQKQKSLKQKLEEKQLAEEQHKKDLEHERLAEEKRKQAEQRAIAQKESLKVLAELKKMKIVYEERPEVNTIYVYPSAWSRMTIGAKEEFSSGMALYCELNCAVAASVVHIKDMYSGKELASYSPLWGFQVKH